MHTSPFLPPGSGDVGGMNVVLRHVGTQLAAMGNHVEVLTRRADPDSPDHAEVAPGVWLRQLVAGPAKPVTKARQEELLPAFSARLAELVQGREDAGWQLLHSHHWFSGVAALPIAQRAGIPHVQSFHSIAAEAGTSLAAGERAEGPGRLPGERQIARGSQAIIAVSRAEARTTAERLGADPGRVAVVAPGVDAAQFHPLAVPAPRAAGVVQDRPRLLVAARLEPLKGVDLVLAALSRIPAAQRPLLEIAGGPTAGFEGYDRELQRLAQQLGVARDVRFVAASARAEFAAHMRSASLVLIPSHSETYGLVALEAAASGVPVIAAAAGGLVEAVVDGVTGVLLPGRDPQAWADAIRSLLADPERRRRLAQAGRAHALTLPWRATAEGWAQVYRRLV